MSSKTLFRWAAIALMVSGVSLALGMILHPEPPLSARIATWRWATSHFFWWLGALAGIAGIVNESTSSASPAVAIVLSA